MGNIKLRQLPLQVFEGSCSPAGLYARQKWMGESNHRCWHKDFSSTVAALAANQAPDGSWNGSVGETSKRLFGLHLTIRDADGVVDKGLDWLLAQLSKEDDRDRIAMPTCPGRGTVEGLPFVVSTKRTFLAGVTLFLATIFGRGDDPDIREQYQDCCRLMKRQTRPWMDTAAAHNLFRAIVVHPDFVTHDAAISHVKHLAEEQTFSGNWGEPVSFYQTFNALAHMDLPQANEQIEKALAMIVHSQNGDGSWGGGEPEWNTFLTVHALKNKGYL